MSLTVTRMSRLPQILRGRTTLSAHRIRLVPLLVPAVALALAAGTAPTPAQALVQAAAPRTTDPQTTHTFRQVTTDAQLEAGTVGRGLSVSGGSLRLTDPAAATTTSYAGQTWRTAAWTSVWTRPGHGFTELIPSWEARTPVGTFVTVKARVAAGTATSGWKVLARWTGHDDGFRRTSAGTQADALASVATDTVRAARQVTLTRYQLRVELHRLPTSTSSPVLRSVQAVASRLGPPPATSRPLYGARSLAVPRFSQMVHRGRYPQWGGGGQAWCSPTALAMVLKFYGRLPSGASYSWVDRSRGDRVVPAVARSVFDHGYDGAGNWAFNTAYASNRAGSAFVTRLRDLRDVERFVAAGVPPVVSISFSRGQLRGAPISSTAGHLVVVRGFTASGDVLVNDPAAPTNASVSRTYDRAQFERAWLSKSRGVTYLVTTPTSPLPQATRLLP